MSCILEALNIFQAPPALQYRCLAPALTFKEVSSVEHPRPAGVIYRTYDVNVNNRNYKSRHPVNNTCQMIRFRWILKRERETLHLFQPPLKLQIWKQSSKMRGSDVAARVYPQQARSLQTAFCLLLHT